MTEVDENLYGRCDRRKFRGWRCVRRRHFFGPCALVPRWWNWSKAARSYRYE